MASKKSKSKLEQAAEVVESLVKETNSKVIVLGHHDDLLYKALIMLQAKFDQIRNVPSDKQLEYKKTKEVWLTWKQHVEKIERDYHEKQTANIGGGASVATFGIGVATLGPTAAMGVATAFGVASTGTAISSLSGAAATNAALAWLGGGALSAGGGGMAAGSTLLGLAGPVGWTFAGIMIVSSALLFWKTEKDRRILERIFLDVSLRDENDYKLAIVEINERINRIDNELGKIYNAILDIGSYGLDYNKMTEDQQYNLGSYVNLMYAATQLLVNPIKGLQPKVTSDEIASFIEHYKIEKLDTNWYKEGNYQLANHYFQCLYRKDLLVYMANLLFKIEMSDSDRELLSKSYRKNKKFRNNFRKDKSLSKDDLDICLFETVDAVLKYKYANTH